MITLHCSGPTFGLPEASPYVTKTEVQLQMLGVRYDKARADLEKSPKGQMPYIRDEDMVIGDSHFIREHLEKKLGRDLDEGLDARQRAEAWAIERMLENHFTPTVTWARWLIPENFAKGPAHFFDGAPEHLRAKLREEVLARVTMTHRAWGVSRHTQDEIVSLAGRSLTALEAVLGDKPYLFGEKPVGVDATAFAVLAAALTPFFDSPIRRKAESYPTLVAYTARMMARYYPGHAWQA